MKARQLAVQDGGDFDLIVAMDSKNEQDIIERLGGVAAEGHSVFVAFAGERDG